jgi:peptidoglycan glycosyltransferase
MVSAPGYGPGSIAENGEALNADPSAPLLNRATQGVYPPGSTFKTVTAAAVLEHGVIGPDTTVECPGELVFDGFAVSCSNVPQGVGEYPFRDAYTFSVNAIFAEVGVELGWERLRDTAREFGFGAAIDFALDTTPSQLTSPGEPETVPLLASTAFGQGQLLATPLQMALVAATIANDGMQMRPIIGLAAFNGDQLVEQLESPSGRRVLDSEVAAQVREFMVAVIANGQAGGVAIEGVRVAGKTGTAESGTGTSHAWFIAFAPADDPQVAVAVVVENGGQGGSVAAPIAGQVIRSALGR